MDERKQRILQAIIQDYIKSAEPVGSRTIARNHSLGVSSATVRNEMYDLEELGFLEQPHTSAGRVPSSKGYRFYVDTMLAPIALAAEDMQSIKSLWQSREGNFEEFFLDVAKLISKVSHNMSMVAAPYHDTAVFRFIHILPVDETQAILVVVSDVYALDNEMLHFTEKVDAMTLVDVAVRLTNFLKNTLLGDFDGSTIAVIKQNLDIPGFLLDIILKALQKALSKRKFFHSVGTLELLGQPEFQSFEKMQPLLSFLEEKDEVSKLLAAGSTKPITVTIGQEHEANSMKNCSLIQADFSTEKGKVGTVAILGPMRMEYDRILTMLNYMQCFLSEIKDK